MKKRGDELVLLSAGRLTLASDGRWSVQSAGGIPGTESSTSVADIRLQLRPVTARDHGEYECQVSTHPPIVRRVHLYVIGKSNIFRFPIAIFYV